MKILSTTNYALFQSNPLQRTFRPAKVDALIEKMKKNDFPDSMCISVYKGKTGKLVLNTGHHRLAAAEALGIAVKYVIEAPWTVQQMIDEGTTGVTWNSAAVVQNYAKSGNKQYEELLRYSNYGIPLNMAASLLIGECAASGNARTKLNTGLFKIKTRDHADTIVALIQKFKARIPAITHRPFLSAISKCLFSPEFDEGVFERRLHTNPAMFEKTSNEEQSLKMIEEIYNYKAGKKIPLAFLVTTNSQARRLSFGKNSA